MGGESPPQTRPSHVPHPRHTSEAGGMAASKIVIRRSGYVCCIETNSSSPLKKGHANIIILPPGRVAVLNATEPCPTSSPHRRSRGHGCIDKSVFGEADMFVA